MTHGGIPAGAWKKLALRQPRLALATGQSDSAAGGGAVEVRRAD